MPGYKEHLGGGVVSGVSLLFILSNYFILTAIPLTLAFEWFMLALAGSLFPDVDIKSKGQKLFYQIIIALILLALYKRHVDFAAYLVLFSIVPIFSRHRGMFHTIWFIVLFPVGTALFAGYYIPERSYSLLYDALFFVVGAWSHLIMDFGVRRSIRFS